MQGVSQLIDCLSSTWHPTRQIQTSSVHAIHSMQCLPNFRSSLDPRFLTSSLALWMKWTRSPSPSPMRLISRTICKAQQITMPLMTRAVRKSQKIKIPQNEKKIVKLQKNRWKSCRVINWSQSEPLALNSTVNWRAKLASENLHCADFILNPPKNHGCDTKSRRLPKIIAHAKITVFMVIVILLFSPGATDDFQMSKKTSPWWWWNDMPHVSHSRWSVTSRFNFSKVAGARRARQTAGLVRKHQGPIMIFKLHEESSWVEWAKKISAALVSTGPSTRIVH